MNSPLVVFSDLHLRQESAEVCFGILDQLILEARAIGTTELGFAGDFFHVRELMPVRLQNRVSDWLYRLLAAGMRLRVIPGNHDQVDVQGRNALEVFEHHPAVRLYSKPERDEYGLWIPYSSDFEAVVERLSMNRSGAVFAHLPVIGAYMNNTLPCDAGVPVEAFDGYQAVMLGHFHKRQQWGHVRYVGSPYEVRSDEAGQPKGFGVWYGDEFRYVDRQWGPRHLKIEAAALEDALAQLQAAGAQPFDRVKVLVPEGAVEAAGAALEAHYPGVVVAPSEVRANAARPLPDRPLGMRDHAERYVGDRHGDLDSAELMAAFDEVTEPHPG